MLLTKDTLQARRAFILVVGGGSETLEALRKPPL
jgi:hypothetical protein